MLHYKGSQDLTLGPHADLGVLGLLSHCHSAMRLFAYCAGAGKILQTLLMKPSIWNCLITVYIFILFVASFLGLNSPTSLVRNLMNLLQVTDDS